MTTSSQQTEIINYKSPSSLIVNQATGLSFAKTLLFAVLTILFIALWSEASPQSTGETGIEGIEGFSFRWDKDQLGGYSFSIKNKLEYPVTDVTVMVVFYDYSGNVIDFQEIESNLTLPAGLSKRMRGKVDTSTLEIVTETDPNQMPEFRGKEAAIKWLKNKKERGPKCGRVEINVLKFRQTQQ